MTKKAPKTSHAELFKQAVISKDFDKFSTVLGDLAHDPGSKRVTIQDLDADLIIPTLNYINEILQDETLRDRTSFLRDFGFTIDFMGMLLDIHSSYLSTLDNLDKQLGSLVRFAQTRSANIDKLNKLSGKIDFVCNRMKLRSCSTTFGEQKEDVLFDDSGKHMKRAARQESETETAKVMTVSHSQPGNANCDQK